MNRTERDELIQKIKDYEISEEDEGLTQLDVAADFIPGAFSETRPADTVAGEVVRAAEIIRGNWLEAEALFWEDEESGPAAAYLMKNVPGMQKFFDSYSRDDDYATYDAFMYELAEKLYDYVISHPELLDKNNTDNANDYEYTEPEDAPESHTSPGSSNKKTFYGELGQNVMDNIEESEIKEDILQMLGADREQGTIFINIGSDGHTAVTGLSESQYEDIDDQWEDYITALEAEIETF